MDHTHHPHLCDETYYLLSIVGCHLPYVRVRLYLRYPHTTYIVFLHHGEGTSCVITPPTIVRRRAGVSAVHTELHTVTRIGPF